jgi:hypothetical protein
MGRRGVAFVAMVAAGISAASLSYAVFWAFQVEPMVRNAPVTEAPHAILTPPVETPLLLTPPAVAAPSATPASAASKVPDKVAPPIKSVSPKPPDADRDMEAAPSEASVAGAPPAADTTPSPPADMVAKSMPQGDAGDAPAAPRPAEPATAAVPPDAPPASATAVSAERIETRRVGRSKILMIHPSAVAPDTPPRSEPPGPFAALPAQTDSPTIGAALASPRALLRHTPRRRVTALPPHVPVNGPAAHEAWPITILRGGPILRPPSLPHASAVALAAPPVVKVIRPRPLDPRLGPPGPLILRIQD